MAESIYAPLTVQSIDRGSALLVPKISDCACRVPVLQHLWCWGSGHILDGWGRLSFPSNVCVPEDIVTRSQLS